MNECKLFVVGIVTWSYNCLQLLVTWNYLIVHNLSEEYLKLNNCVQTNYYN